MQQGQLVSGLSLEAYLQLHKALTKHEHTVQAVTPIEECYYKISDLRQLLQLHGLTAAKFNRAELLAAMKGQKLINPCSNSYSCSSSDGSHLSAEMQAGKDRVVAHVEPPFSAADVCAVLGMPAASGSDSQPLQFLQLTPAVAAAAPAHTEDAKAADLGNPKPTGLHGGTSVAAPTKTGSAEPTAASQQPAAGNHAAPHAPAQAPAHDHQQQHPAQHLASHTSKQDVLLQQQQKHPVASAGSQQDHLQKQELQQLTLHQQQQDSCWQHEQQDNTGGVPAGAAGAAPSSLQGDPMQQLLTLLLSQYTSGTVPGTTADKAVGQPQQPAHGFHLQPGPSSNITASAQLLQQILQGAAASQLNMATPPAAADTATSAQETAPQAAKKHGAGPEAEPVAAGQCAASSKGVVQQGATMVSPEQSHTPWLKAHLQWFASSGVRAVAAATSGGSDGSLLGHRVGFVLLEQMQVCGPRNIVLTLPPGVYEGMTVKYLGSNCQSDVCEHGCPGQHEFYRARLLPPRMLPDADSACEPGMAANLAQAQAAASGRPVLLILDLHHRLRSETLQDLLYINTPEQLQDAWVLLDHEGEASSPTGTPAEQPAAAAAHKRGKVTGSSRPGPGKRTKV